VGKIDLKHIHAYFKTIASKNKNKNRSKTYKYMLTTSKLTNS
jgi:hypothetical protein